MDILLEATLLTAVYNKCKNGKEVCDYQCGQKLQRDAFLQPKLNVCKATCDVIWDGNFVKQLQNLITTQSSQLDSQTMMDYRRRLDGAKQRLFNSKQRLLKTKMTLRKQLYGRRSDMSMRLAKPGPAFER